MMKINNIAVTCVGFALATALPATPAKACPPGSSQFGAVTTFGDVPDPGHPFGVLATDNGVYVTTSSGSPVQRGEGEDAVFRYSDEGGQPVARSIVQTMPDMGLYGMAEDGDGRIYVVDMNGQVLRFTPNDNGLTGPEVYATNPYQSLGWETSMWVSPTLDGAGNLYVTDERQGAIWRIPPNGAPEIWFQDPRLMSVPLGGLNGLAIGPDNNLYVVVAEGAIFRLPLTNPAPSADKLELFHAFGPERDGYPVPFAAPSDLAFGSSGRLYVTLVFGNKIAVLSRDGDVVQEIASDAFDAPVGMRFDGTSLLVANSSYVAMNPAHWQILRVVVDEPGLPLAHPLISG